MGFRLTVASTVFFAAADLVLLTLRPPWPLEDLVMQYVLLVVHLFVAIVEGINIFAFFSNTIWFTAGLLGKLAMTVRASLPLWVLRLIFVAVPWLYRNFGPAAVKTAAFDDNVYVFLYVAEQIVAMAFWISMLYTMACMSEATMYAPYHREAMAAVAEQQRQQEMLEAGADIDDMEVGPDAAADDAGGMP